MLVSLRTNSSEMIELNLRDDVTVRDVKRILVHEYGYSPSVQLMYSTRIVADDAAVDDFPIGTLVVVGQRGGAQPPRQVSPQIPTRDSTRQSYANNYASANANNYQQPLQQPQQQSRYQSERERLAAQQQSHTAAQQHQYQPHHYTRPAQSRQPQFADQPQQPQHRTPQADRTRQPNEQYPHSQQQYGQTQHQHQPSDPRTPQPFVSPSQQQSRQPHVHRHHHDEHRTPGMSPRQGAQSPSTTDEQQQHSDATSSPQSELAFIEVHATIPALNEKVVAVTIPSNALVQDLLVALIAQEPAAAGCKLLFFGKYIRNVNESVRSVPLHDKSQIMVASGPFLNEHIMTLYLANRTYRSVLAEVDASTPPIPSNVKNHWNEQLMKALLQLDSLQDVDDDIRAQRKALVKSVTALQDRLS